MAEFSLERCSGADSLPDSTSYKKINYKLYYNEQNKFDLTYCMNHTTLVKSNSFSGTKVQQAIKSTGI